MRKTTVFFIALFLMCIIFVPQTEAYADYDYFSLEYSVSPDSVPESGTIVDLTVKIEVDLNSAYALNDAGIYFGDTEIIDFRNIYAGQSVTKTGSMEITPEMVGEDIVFTLSWTTDGATYQTDTFTVEFGESSVEPEVEFTRVAVPQSGEPTTETKLTYTVSNVGTLHISEVEITDALAGAVDYKEIVKSGESYVFTYERTISSGFSSQPTLTYTVGEKSYSVELDAIEITSGEPAIDLEVETNKDVVAEGEELTIICTVSNTGTADFTFISISEDTLGDLFEMDSLEAGESQTFTTNVTIEESTTLNFLAAGGNGTEQEWVDEESVEITVDEESAPLNVEIDASPSSLMLEIAGEVEFDIVINNNGEEELEGLRVLDQDGNTIIDIDALAVGKSVYQWAKSIEETTTFTFYLQVPQEDGSVRSVNSGPIEVTVNQTVVTEEPEITATEEPTAEPVITQEEVNVLKKLASNLGLIVAGVLVLAILIAIIVSRTRR